MHIGMVGLGRMGGNMRDRIRAAGHEVTGFDADPEISEVGSLADLVAALPAGERIVWVMVPAGAPTRCRGWSCRPCDRGVRPGPG